jgi:hypothetical protein
MSTRSHLSASRNPSKGQFTETTSIEMCDP